MNPTLVASAVRNPADHRLALMVQLETETAAVIAELIERAAGDETADMFDQTAGTGRQGLETS